jgi:2,4-dienoyl-CoA reductase-like NADH-dependent reductase (Old Yellow Enzyme family)
MIETAFELPSGLVVPNRIVKAATSEKLAGRRGVPNEGLARLYERWGRGGSGMLITGNVIVDPAGREGRGNVVVEDDRHLDALSEWARRAQANGSKLVMQISHAGRQTPKAVSRRPVAPSPIGLKGVMGLAGKPRALEDHEIEILVNRFARTALIAKRAGFSGVQLHGAHGYLISQFLSPLTNQRTDRWGGSLENRMRFLLRTLAAVRGAVGTGFAVGIKLNSADFQRGGFSEDESMEVAAILDGEGVDFLEISGGNYESSAMFNGSTSKRKSTRQREAYFIDYVEKVRERVKLPLMLTGGFRSARGMNEALSSGAVDLVGMARPLIVEPDLAQQMIADPEATAVKVNISARSRLLSDVFQGTWYGRQLRRMAAGREPDATLGRWTSMLLEGPKAYGYNPLAGLWQRDRAVAELPAMAAQSTP